MSASGLDFASAMAAYRANRFVPVAPRERDFTTPAASAEAFRAEGANLAGALVDAGLEAGHDVLDIGSGLGRVALPLTQFLTGSYFGIDINLSGVAWCHENITQVYPSFRFAVVNARNDKYGHGAEMGQDRLEHTSLPIPPELRFDFAWAYSLFTHLDWAETLVYLEVVAARLRPGGRFMSTWYLINDEARAGTAAGRADYDFALDGGGPDFRVTDLSAGPGPVGHDEGELLAAAAALGLEPVSVVHSGWPAGVLGQDRIVFVAAAG